MFLIYLKNVFYLIFSTILYYILYYILKNYFIILTIIRLLIFFIPFIYFIKYYFTKGILIKKFYIKPNDNIDCLINIFIIKPYNSGFKFIYSFKKGFNLKIIIYMIFIRYVGISILILKFCYAFNKNKNLYKSLCYLYQDDINNNERIILGNLNCIFNPPKFDMSKIDRFNKIIENNKKRIDSNKLSPKKVKKLEKDIKNKEKYIEKKSFEIKAPSPTNVESLTIDKFSDIQIKENNYVIGVHESLHRNEFKVRHPSVKSNEDENICFGVSNNPLKSGNYDSKNNLNYAYEYNGKKGYVYPASLDGDDRFIEGDYFEIKGKKSLSTVLQCEKLRSRSEIDYTSNSEVYRNHNNEYNTNSKGEKVEHKLNIKRFVVASILNSYKKDEEIKNDELKNDDDE